MIESLVVVKEGVFPITKDQHGSTIDHTPNTGFNMAGTIQGEGKRAGTSALFIRLASCNLRCIWKIPDNSSCMCDTPYASFNPDTPTNYTIEDIVSIIKHNIGELKHIVITGGEPLLQKEGLAILCTRLKRDFGVHITIETNGTIFCSEVAKYVDLFSISPKLKKLRSNRGKSRIFRFTLYRKYKKT